MKLSKGISWQNLLIANFEREPKTSVVELLQKLSPLLDQMSTEADKKSNPPTAPYKIDDHWVFSDGSWLSFCEAFGTFTVFVMHWKSDCLFGRPKWVKVSEGSIKVTR